MQFLLSPTGKARFEAMPAGEVPVAAGSAPSEPSLWEVLLMFAAAAVLHLLAFYRVRSFWDVVASGAGAGVDNDAYLQLATIIHNGHSMGEHVPPHFWGFSYAIIGVAKLFSIPEVMALVLISILSSLAVCILVHRLYGGWVAAAFIFINYEWIQLSIEGGAEPLFLCILCAGFLAARSSRWNLATFLVSMSTTVRPVGVFALLAFAAVLGLRKSWRQLTITTLIALAIGALYVLPVWIILGNPFANLIGYRGAWVRQGWPIAYPFGTLVPSYLRAYYGGTRWYRLVFLTVWPIVSLVGIRAMWLPRNRRRYLSIHCGFRGKAVTIPKLIRSSFRN